METVVIEEISKRFGDKQAVAGVSFRVQAGEILVC